MFSIKYNFSYDFIKNLLKYDVAIIGGLGHIGLPLGILFANKNKNVLLVDSNLEHQDKVMQGEMPFLEYGAEELLRRALEKNLINITSKAETIKNANYIIICIGTPVDEYLNPKVNQFLDAILIYREYINEKQIVIIRSSVYPGISNQVNQLLGPGMNLSYCPERIVQGYAVKEISNLPQIVSGFSEKAINESAKLFEEISKNIIYTTVTKAELAKLFSNTWRYIQFAATNQFYMISHDLGEDYSEIRNLMMENYPRMAGLPSAGFAAGPCLLKDTMQLANLSRNANFMAQAAMNINERMPEYIIDLIKREHKLVNVEVGILGMAFKANVDDTRDSLSFKLKKLLNFEGAIVYCSDEFVQDTKFISKEELINTCNIVIIGVPHDAYKNIKFSNSVILFDIWSMDKK